MKYLIIIYVHLLCISSFAQLSSISYNNEIINEFYKSKSIAVLTGNKNFDSALIKYMKEIWTITPYEFIKEKDFKNSELKKGFSYILNLNFVVSKTDGSFSKTYHYYGVLMGKDKKINNYSYAEMISYCPIDFYGIENDQLDIYKRIELVLYNLQNTIHTVVQNKIEGGSLKIANDLRRIYNQNAGVLKSKTLLVNKDRSKLLSQEDFKKKYPYKFEYCTMEKIQEVIYSRDSNYAIYWPAITLNKSMFVFDANTYIPLFFDYQMQGLNITAGNISDLSETINKSKLDKLPTNFFALKSKDEIIKGIPKNENNEEKIIDKKIELTKKDEKQLEKVADEKPKPVEKKYYTPSSVSPGRKATDSEMDFFNKLREQQPDAEPAK